MPLAAHGSCGPAAEGGGDGGGGGGGGVALRDVGVRYRVRGPRKDYVSESWYARE